MKKLLLTLLILVPFVASAAPFVSFQPSLVPIFNDTYYLGTTTPTTLEWLGIFAKNLTLSNLAGSGTRCVQVNNSGALSVAAAACGSGGGGGTPGGLDTQVQFNDGGSSFGGDANLTFQKTTGLLTGLSSLFTFSTTTNLLATGSSTLQNFTFINATGTNATTTNTFSTSFFTATGATATSTITNALQIGATRNDSALNVVAGRVYPASVTTGGMVHIDNGSTNTGPALEVTSNAGQTTGRMIVFNDTNTGSTQDMIVASSSCTNCTVENFKGNPTGKGILKIEHTGNGTGYANSSGISIDLLNASDAQGVFIKDSVGGTGKMLNIVDSSSGALASIDSGGNLILKGNSTTTDATTTDIFSTLASTTQLFLATGNGCLQVTSGQVLSTGSNCGSGSGAVSSVSNSDGTLTISPTTGAVVASLNLGQGNVWTAASTTFVNGVTLGTSTTTSATTTNFSATTASTSKLFLGTGQGCASVNSSGQLTASGAPCNSGTVTSVATNNGIAGGTITTSGTLSLDQTFGAIWTAASTTFVNGVTMGTATVTSATTTNFSTTNASTTKLVVSNSPSALLLTDATGLVGKYGGASACASNNFVTTISATGGTTCGTASISGVNLGSNLNSLSNDGATLSGSSYNGSAAVSNWAINLANQNVWTGASTTFVNGVTIGTATTTNATTTNFNIAGTLTVSGATATSTITNALQFGSTAGDHAITVTAGRVYPASVSTGGMVFLNNGTTNSGPALEVVSGFGSGATGRAVVFNETNTAFDQDFILASSSASNTTVLNIKGQATGKGLLKIEHTGNGTGFSNASGLSIDLLNATDAQGVFIKGAIGGTGKLLNIVDSGSAALASIDSSGNLILKGNSTTTNATTSAFAITNIASGNCLHTTTGGAVVGTGSDCGSGGGGGNSKWATSTDTGYPANKGIYPNGTNIDVGIGTTTPQWQLEIASSTGPQLALSDSVITDPEWVERAVGQNLYFATTSPSTFATATTPSLTLFTGSTASTAAVGIGTSTPDRLLTVDGNQAGGIVDFVRNVGASPSAGGYGTFDVGVRGTSLPTSLIGPSFTFKLNGSELGNLQFKDSGSLTTGQFYLYVDQSGSTLATSSLTFNGSNGAGGVGTDTPAFMFEISSTTAPQLALDNPNGSTNAQHALLDWTGSELDIGTSSDTTYTSTSSALRLLPASSPAVIVASTTATATLTLGTYMPKGSTIGSTTPAVYIGVAGSTTPSFYVGTANQNGNVGVSSSTPDAQFAVQANGGTTNMFEVGVNGSSTPSIRVDSANLNGGVFINASSTLTNATETATMFMVRASTTNLFLSTGTCNGATNALGVTSGKVSCDSGVSDERLKTHITPLLDGLDTLDKLRPVNFDWINPTLYGHSTETGLQYGFIAQEVQKILPALVSRTTPSYLTPDGALELNQQEMIPILVKSVQELDEKVNNLGGAVKRSAEENWQDGLIGLLVLYVLYNEWDKRRK